MTTPEHSPPPAPSDDADAPEPSASKDRQTPETTPAADAGRPRVLEAGAERGRGWEAVVRVVLERGGVRATSERKAVGEEAVLFRCTAEATLEALEELLGGRTRFALVGAKRMLAFDSAVLLACVRTLEEEPRKLIGCVPIQDDAVEAVARAVLHATNRMVEAIPNRNDPTTADEPTPES